MTPAVTLLKLLCQGDVVAFMPEDNTAAAGAKYDATIESLREMKKAGWIELEVNKPTGRQGGREGVKRAAAARCTEAGREALRLLGEA